MKPHLLNLGSRQIVATAAVGLLLANACVPLRVGVVPGWHNVVFEGTGPLLGTLRQQVADILYGGERRFAIAYIEGAPGTLASVGPLGLVHADIDKNVRTVLPKTELSSTWVRGATGGPIDTGGCPLVVTPVALDGPVPANQLVNPEFVDYFSADDFASAANTAVYIVRVRWCNGAFTTRTIRVGQGSVPAVAIGKRGNETKLLVVYGRGSVLRGQFLDTDGNASGSEFSIAPFDDALKSTDVIWNPISARFIVGYMRYRPSFDSLDPNLCSVQNVLVDWDGNAATPVLRGVCDAMRSGHHTYVDYDDRPFSNPQGRYYWWYQDLAGNKALHLMDSTGNPVSDPGVVGSSSNLTAPVSHRRSRTTEFVVAQSALEPPGDYVSVQRSSATIEVRFLSDAGNLSTLGNLPGELPPMGNVIPVALENLPAESVMLSREDPGPIVDNNNTRNRWGISVFSHRRPTVLAPDR